MAKEPDELVSLEVVEDLREQFDMKVERDVVGEAASIAEIRGDHEQVDDTEEETVEVPKRVLTSLVDAFAEKSTVEQAAIYRPVLEMHGLSIMFVHLWTNSDIIALGKWLAENHTM